MQLESHFVLRCTHLLWMIALLTSALSLQAETFTNPRLIPTDSNPVAVAVADFNGDGKPDLLYVDGGALGTFHVLLGNGDATFQQVPEVPPWSGEPFVVADVNHDGKLDVVVAEGGPNPYIFVLLGNGDGTFQSPIRMSLPVNGMTQAVIAGCAVGDFNGDGAADLIVTDEANSYIYVLLGNNTGYFTLKTTIQQNSGPTSVWVGDLNGDGHQDFVVSDLQSGDNAVFLGNGDGTFKPPVRYPGGNALLADMDGDGHPDLVVAASNVLSIYHGNADGTFAATSSGGSSNAGPIMKLLAAADFNGDGILDIAANGDNGIEIFLGKGNLTYAPPASYGAGPAPVVLPTLLNQEAAMADFNQDGHPDFALVAPGGIALLFGNSNGTLQSFNTYDVGTAPTGVAVADFNGDHVADIAVNIGTLTPLIMFGQGGGKFSHTPVTPPTLLNGAPQLLTGDFNGDGKADLLLAAGDANPGTLLYGNGDGTFSPTSITGATALGPFLASVADINHDGISDFAELSYESVSLFLGEKNDTVAYSSIFTGIPAIAAPAFGDFNHDGKLDMVMGGLITMQVYLGNGDGTFNLGRTLQTEYPDSGGTLTAPQVICTGDFNGDGNVDILALLGPLQVIEVWYGNGDGTFQDPVFLWLSRTYSQMACADVNSDGKPDLVLSDSKVIAIIHNNGQGKFGPEVQYLAGTVGSFVVQDVNGDGAPDIVIANGSSATTVSVLLNQPGGASVNGTLTVSPEPSASGQPFTITLTLQAANAGGGTPTGTVSFSDAYGPLGTVALTNGMASFIDTFPELNGLATILVEYSGDATFSPGTFTVMHKVVQFAYPTTTTLVAAPNPVLAGQTVSFKVTVTSTGENAPSREVAIYDGNTTLGTVSLQEGYENTNSGVVDSTLSSPGPNVITAAYLGDEYSAPSTSAPVTVVVNANSTSTALSALPGTVQAGAPVSLTAVVSSATGKPAGAAVFWDGTTAIGAQPLDATGTAVYIATFSTTGTHSLKAVYQQNGSYTSSSSSALNLVVNPSSASSSSNTALNASQNPDGTGSLNLTATVTTQNGTPTGGVVFYEGATPVGEVNVGPTGIATFTSPVAASGTYYFTAYYQGSAKFAPSVGSVLWGGASSKQPDFTLGAAPPSSTMLGGQSTTVNVAVIPRNGFGGAVALSCSTGTPSLSCSLVPPTVYGGSGTSLMTITASQGQAAFLPIHLPATPGQQLGLAAMLLGLLGLFVTCRVRGRWAFGALGLIILGTALACRPPTMASLAPPGSYQVTVTASSVQAGTQISHVLSVQVNVAAR